MNNLDFQDFGPITVNPNNDPRPPGELGDQSCLFTSDGTSNRSRIREKTNFFSFEFYRQYFDVDTDEVLSRIWYSMLPQFPSNFITDHIQPLPDLWGPFWISVTLIFSTAICGNLAKYIETSGASAGYQYGSDFRLVTGASTIIFCYVVLVPFVLYSLFWYRRSYLQYSYLDILCAYGYSLSVFVPVSNTNRFSGTDFSRSRLSSTVFMDTYKSLLVCDIAIIFMNYLIKILWILQVQWFRWLLIFLSVALSGSVLVSSIWPAIRNDRNKAIALGTILSVLLLHSLVAVGFKEYYFDASLPSKLETENFHLLHQQVRNIAHSHAQLEVNTAGNSLITPNEIGGQQVKIEKLKEDSGNTVVKGDDAVTGIAKQDNATVVPEVRGKISKPV